MTSATSETSTKSSVLEPRLRDSDLRFISLNMFGKDTLKDLHSPIKPKVAGSNIGLINDATTWEMIVFDFRRRILSLLFWCYSILLEISGMSSELSIILANLFWTVFSSVFLNFEQLERDFSYIQHEQKRSGRTTSSTIESALAFGNSIRELPLKFRHSLWKRVFRSRFPNSRFAIQLAAGKGPFPETIGFVFDMFPLVVQPPPEIPVPYLDANKKMIIPDKKEVSIVLRARAEWSAAQRTHKATETLRVCSEAAKVIVWSACIGVSNVVCHEINGYAWRNMETLISLVKLELASLDRKNSNETLKIPDYISFVNVITRQMKTLAEYNLQSGAFSETSVALEGRDPLPEKSPFLSSSDLNRATSTSSSDTPVHLTVFLTSGSKWTDYDKIVKLAQDLISTSPKKRSKSLGEVKFASVANISNAYYPSPEILLKYTSARQIAGSISGFPLHPTDNDLKIFSVQTRPANFPDFVRVINGYSEKPPTQYGSDVLTA